MKNSCIKGKNKNNTEMTVYDHKMQLYTYCIAAVCRGSQGKSNNLLYLFITAYSYNEKLVYKGKNQNNTEMTVYDHKMPLYTYCIAAVCRGSQGKSNIIIKHI